MTFRPFCEQDTSLITEWISRDQDHLARGITAEFFARMFTLVVNDSAGPIMFIGIGPDFQKHTARVYVQFNYGQEHRTAIALLRAFPIVSALLKKSGHSQMIFESVSKPLIIYCKRRLGFRSVPGTNDYIAQL